REQLCVFLHQHSTSSILHRSAFSLRQFFLSQGDTFSEHGVECQRILCRLHRVLLLFARRVFLEKRQKHVAVFLVRLTVRLHIGDLPPRKTHFTHPFFSHPLRLSAPKIAQQPIVVAPLGNSHPRQRLDPAHFARHPRPCVEHRACLRQRFRVENFFRLE